MRALSFSGDSATGGRILFAPLIYAKFDTPQLVTLVNVFVDQMCTVSLRHWGCADSLWSDEELTTCMRAHFSITPRPGNSLNAGG